MQRRRILPLVILLSLAVPLASHSAGRIMPKYDPPAGFGTKEFDWQAEWGSIHMNSFFDGINDPGTFATGTGGVGCPGGGICTNAKVKKEVSGLAVPTGPQVNNGIKFDIKNSILFCMSKPVTNWAINNPWDSDTTVCLEKYGLKPPLAHDKHSILFLPVWDKRSNDERDWQISGEVGCQQQIINNCATASDNGAVIRDVHSCVNQTVMDTEPGYSFPVTHVFSKEEVEDLGGAGLQLPTTYFAYEKDLGGGKARVALSATDPKDFPDRVKSKAVKAIKAESDPILARLKAFRFHDTDPSLDQQEFIIVDPDGFYDLRLYTPGGKYDAGYNKFYVDKKTKQRLVETFDTCPVLGLKNGYSGICDPTGEAGCNLPIYGVGPSTTFTDTSGKEFVYNDYPIKWSGYVKKWAVLSVKQYLENIKGREELYLLPEDGINENPIVMLTRSDDYCEPLERTSRLPTCKDKSMPEPDMNCIHYMQYTPVDESKTEYVFLDLYNPVASDFETRCDPEFNVLELYDKDEHGNPIASQPALGSGSDRYINPKKEPSSSLMKFASFLDNGERPWPAGSNGKRPKAAYNRKVVDEQGKVAWVSEPALKVEKPVLSNSKDRERYMPGYYLGEGANQEEKGTGVPVRPGQAALLRPTENLAYGGNSTSCVVVTYFPNDPQKPEDKGTSLFIPTNSQAEIQAFVSAMEREPVNYASLRPCATEFEPNREHPFAVEMGLIPAEKPVSTWLGRLSCDELIEKPSCNETRRISAKRFCRLENGSYANCGECAKAKDADATWNEDFFDWHWDPAADSTIAERNVNGYVMANPIIDDDSNCFFAASCFNGQAEGCPTAGSSGGHVFCVSADTKITMANGREKAIVRIRPGEEVATFNAKATRGAMIGKGKVKAVAVTRNQPVIKINELRITPPHKVVLASGRPVPAKDLKLGDRILGADGRVVEVRVIDTKQPKITVYNLVLENGRDGYIAGGLRVMSYPVIKEMDDTKSAFLDKR